MNERFDMVVVGAGPAGEKAAAQAAYFGKRVAVVESAPALGGAMAAQRGHDQGHAGSRSLPDGLPTSPYLWRRHRPPSPGCRSTCFAPELSM